MSSRIAERTAVIASSWCWYLRSSTSSLRASAVLEARSAQAHEGAHDKDSHGDGALGVQDVGGLNRAMLGECPGELAAASTAGL
jgi:hypothetical protein